jgi:hypothetical protein
MKQFDYNKYKKNNPLLKEEKINESTGVTLTKMDLQVIIKSLESDKILNAYSRQQLIEKLQDLYTGAADFINYLG